MNTSTVYTRVDGLRVDILNFRGFFRKTSKATRQHAHEPPMLRPAVFKEPDYHRTEPFSPLGYCSSSSLYPISIFQSLSTLTSPFPEVLYSATWF
jgi:hypothetical protein